MSTCQGEVRDGSLGKDVGRLIRSFDVTYLYDANIHFLSSKGLFLLKMFSSMMEYWVLGDFDATLIVTLEDDGLRGAKP